MTTIDAAPTSTDLFDPVRLGPVTLRNRTIKSATFEAASPGGQVSERLIDYHRRPAAGGVGMTTLAYCSASPDGRTYRDQIVVGTDTLDGLRRLTDAVHAEGAAAAMQLGHAGYFASPHAIGTTPVGPSRVFNPAGLAFSRPATEDDLDRLERDFAQAAALAVDAGFDCVELHLGHGYLLSQFLSPFTNRRRDRWGGDIEGRAAFPRRVCRAVADAVDGRAAVTAKLNMLDGFARGLQIEDGVAVARMLEADGALDALELTAGFTSKTPMFLMRGDVPLREMIAMEPHPARRIGLKLAAGSILKAYPFQEAFLLGYARQVRAAVDMPLILLGGITQLSTMQRARAEGFDMVAMARALLREPDLVARMATGEATTSRCVPCNRCVVEMDRAGTRCVMTYTDAPGRPPDAPGRPPDAPGRPPDVPGRP